MMKKGFQFLLLFLITVTLTFPSVSCGGSGNSAPAVTPPPTSGAGNPSGGNQAPVVKSLTAKPEALKPDEIAEMRCEATDADGDVLTYSWSADGGAFTTEAVSKQFWINWRAPKFTGNFTISVNLTDGRGGSTTKTYMMSVVNNRAPVISKITVNPPGPKPNDSCTLTATASDPDGDTITYKWLTNAGTVAGSGNTGTWVAPATDGIYEIQLVASDGKDGGTSNQTIKITVQTPSNSVTLSQVPAESGTVASSSDLSTTYYRAGDDENNNGLRAFFSFDLSSLKGATVSSATLSFTVKQTVGNPFSITPPSIYVQPVYYGPRALKGADYDMSSSGADINIPDSKIPGEYNQTGPVNDAASSGRYQISVKFNGKTNSNKIADYVEFSGATLKITFQQ
jgi:hypothetical protein